MSAPKPKTKLDEVADIIYKDTDSIYLEEFQEARLIRLTRSGDSIDPIRAKKHRMVIYYLSGKYEESKKELISLIPYTKQDLDLFVQVLALAKRIGAFQVITEVASKIDLSMLFAHNDERRQSILDSLGAPFCLIGDFSEGVKNMERIHKALESKGDIVLSKNFDNSKQMREAYLQLSLDGNKVKKLMSFIEEIVARNKIRVLGVFISTPDNEFLVDLGVNDSIDKLIRFNDELFDIAYTNKLTEELNSLSINFSPIDMEQVQYAIF